MSVSHEHSPIHSMSLHDITAEYGEAGLLERLSYEIHSTEWDEETIQLAERAATDSLKAHENDSRGEHPYSTHFLRVAIRIVSDEHINVQDPDIVIAALLHDTVEDHPEFFTQLIPNTTGKSDREHAFYVIRHIYGANVADLVAAVTNPELPAGLDHDERNDFYREHVRYILATEPEAGIIKLSDFIDNCAGLKHNEDPDLTLRLAKKYYPLIGDFIDFIEQSELIEGKDQLPLIGNLLRAKKYCEELMYGPLTQDEDEQDT